MRLTKRLVPLFALLLVPCLFLAGQTAPAPNENESAKASLAALKKKLPEVLKGQLADKNRWRLSYEGKIKLLRQIDSNEAKLTILLEATNQAGGVGDEVMFIYLKRHDGVWTTSRFDEAAFVGNRAINKGIMFLMAAIDELAEQ